VGVDYRQLLPVATPAPTTDALAVAAAVPSADADAPRPRLIANFITSLDGHATLDGRSGQLGDAGDKDIFRALRERADAVLAGTQTLQVERYGRVLPAAERRQRRLDAGRSAEPLLVTVTRNGQLPLDIPLFDEPEAELVVFAPQLPPLDAVRATIHHERYDPTAPEPLRHALTTLRDRYGVRLLLCEGGPTLFAALLAEGLVDELFLTLAPKLAGGGDGPRITNGPALPEPAGLRLLGLLERDSTLFARYAIPA
jgi:riboflavin biosynthesis pyrimidine reductase